MTSSDNSPKQTEAAAGNIDQHAVKPGGLSKKQAELMHSRLLSANFGNMVTVMMQSSHHQSVPLSELHNRLVPPLIAKQFRVAEVAKEGSGMTIPVGLIIWACVSDEIHERLQQQLDKPLLLKGDEWTSGDNFWIIDVVGAQRFLAPLLTGLRKAEFKDRTVHYRTRTKDGVEVRTLNNAEDAAQTQSDIPPATELETKLNGASPTQ